MPRTPGGREDRFTPQRGRGGNWTPGGREDRFTPQRQPQRAAVIPQGEHQQGDPSRGQYQQPSPVVMYGGTGSHTFVARHRGEFQPPMPQPPMPQPPMPQQDDAPVREHWGGRPSWTPSEAQAALEYARQTRGGQEGAYNQTRRGQTEEELNRSDPQVYEPVVWEPEPLPEPTGRTPEEERAAWLQARENVLAREDISWLDKQALRYLVPYGEYRADERPGALATWAPAKAQAKYGLPYAGTIEHSMGNWSGQFGSEEWLGAVYQHEALHAADRISDEFVETERIIKQEGRYYIPDKRQSDHTYVEWGSLQPFSIPQELEQFYKIYTEEGKELPEGYKWIKKEGKLVLRGPDGYAPRVRQVTGVGEDGKLEINYDRASRYDLTDKGKQQWTNYQITHHRGRASDARKRKKEIKVGQENWARQTYDPYTDEMRPAPTEEETSNILQRIANNLRMWGEFPLAKG